MPEPIVARVDHVFVPVADPAPHLELFSGELGLPVAWPVTNKGSFTSAAVCVGNANIEWITAHDSTAPFLEPTEPLCVRGVAFEPHDGERMVDELSARGFDHSGAVPHDDAGGSWTNVFLPGMMPRSALIFLCDYRGETREQRRAVREEFASGGGGPLGVRRLAEVTLGVLDVPAAMDAWSRLLAPAEPERQGAFRLGDGPAIRIKESPMEGVAGLWLEVASLDKARDALRKLDLLGPMRASGMGLDYAKTGGLDVWLTEPR